MIHYAIIDRCVCGIWEQVRRVDPERRRAKAQTKENPGVLSRVRITPLMVYNTTNRTERARLLIIDGRRAAGG